MSRARHVISSISSAREDFRRKELWNCTELWVGRKCFQHTANMVVQSIVDAFRHNGLTFSFLLLTGVPWQFHAKRDLVVSCALRVCWVGMQMEGRGQASGGSSFLWFVAHWKSALLEKNCTLGLDSMKTPLMNPPRPSMNKVLYTHTTLNDCCYSPMPSRSVQY